MIYLDNAATTQRKPDCVVQAVTEALCRLGNPGRGIHDGALSASRIVFEARLALAELFPRRGARSDCLYSQFHRGAEHGHQGDPASRRHVITTALEHNQYCGRCMRWRIGGWS